MQLDPGQIVLLKHTRERAKIIGALADGQWMVEAEMDRERFPVHEDDIDPAISAAKPKPLVTDNVTPSDIRLLPGTAGAEVQLAFIPVGELDFNVALLNHSEETLVYAARLLTNRGQQWEKHGILTGIKGIQLGHLYRDLLNESAVVEVQVSRKAEMGTDSKQQHDVNLKPKLFHKNTKLVNWYPEEIAVFDVFAKVRLIRQAKPTLAQYTKENAPEVKEIAKKPATIRDYGVRAAAEFETELDLHIEQLVDDYQSLTGSEMLDIQLAHMRKYLDVAIRIGIDRVFLIHGNGKGLLRASIHKELSKMGDLEGFKNEYHPKYGHGATEVILR